MSLRKIGQFLSLPVDIQWRAALVRLPWLVPLQVLKVTTPEGPYPFIIQMTSRGQYKIPVYVFLPPEASRTDTHCPVHLDFHGGGFIMGSVLEQAPFCAMVAREKGCIVLSVDYRKGPLDKFPAAIEDAEDVLAAVLDKDRNSVAGRELRDNIRDYQKDLNKVKAESKSLQPKSASTLDPCRVSMSGFSSGGNIALNLALSVRTSDIKWPSIIPNDPQWIPLLLYYPSFDARLLPSERPRPSNMPAVKSRVNLALDDILMPTYLPKEQRSHPRASPGLVDIESLHPRAKVFLVLPEMDTLSEQSEVWIKKMEDAKQSQRLQVYRAKGMKHGWVNFPESWIGDAEKAEKKRAYDAMWAFWNKAVQE